MTVNITPKLMNRLKMTTKEAHDGKEGTKRNFEKKIHQ